MMCSSKSIINYSRREFKDSHGQTSQCINVIKNSENVCFIYIYSVSYCAKDLTCDSGHVCDIFDEIQLTHIHKQNTEHTYLLTSKCVERFAIEIVDHIRKLGFVPHKQTRHWFLHCSLSRWQMSLTYTRSSSSLLASLYCSHSVALNIQNGAVDDAKPVDRKIMKSLILSLPLSFNKIFFRPLYYFSMNVYRFSVLVHVLRTNNQQLIKITSRYEIKFRELNTIINYTFLFFHRKEWKWKVFFCVFYGKFYRNGTSIEKVEQLKFEWTQHNRPDDKERKSERKKIMLKWNRKKNLLFTAQFVFFSFCFSLLFIISALNEPNRFVFYSIQFFCFCELNSRNCITDKINTSFLLFYIGEEKKLNSLGRYTSLGLVEWVGKKQHIYRFWKHHKNAKYPISNSAEIFYFINIATRYCLALIIHAWTAYNFFCHSINKQKIIPSRKNAIFPLYQRKKKFAMWWCTKTEMKNSKLEREMITSIRYMFLFT